MKKIYSILLMAVALLISTNLKAVTVNDETGLRNAIEVAGNGSTINVTLGADIILDAPISIYAKYADAGNVVNLDLNGKTITADAGAFKVYKGTLNLNGSGTITSTQGTANKIDMIVMYGSPVSTDADWSILNVGQNVKVINWGGTYSGEEKGNAITVMGFFAAQYAYVPTTTVVDEFGAWNEQLINPASVSSPISTKANNGIQLYKDGKIDYGTSFYPYGYYNVAGYVKNTSGDTYDVNAYYKDNNGNEYLSAYNRYCKSDGKGGYKAISNNVSEKSRAFGVVVNIDGYVYGNRYAFKTNGTIVYNSGNIPVVNINPTADIRCKENGTTTSAAVYSSGYSKVNIKGTVSGSAPVYIKSGEVVIEDAVITCTNDEFQSIAGGASGIEGSGAAITVESNSNYAGGQQLTIKGDTKVTAGADGVAVQETIAQNDESKVSHITIQGGQLEGGANGAVLLENNTVQDGKVTIYGATAEGNITVEGSTATTEEVVALLKPENIDTYVVEVTDDAGNTTYVITEGSAPVAAEVTFDINDATAGADINLSASGLVNREQELTGDKKLGTLIINNENNVTLTIAANKTLEVEKLILNEKAQIVVKAGAKLIVDGNQGITAPSVNNIVVEASGAAQGQVLFDPAVVSGRHPNATVEYTASSYLSGSEFVFDFFGQPMYNGQVESVTASPANRAMIVYSWNNDTHDYDLLGYLNQSPALEPASINNDFGFYAVTSNNAQSAPMTMTFKGSVNGNNDVTRTLTANNYTTFANGYLGNMDEAALYAAATTWGAQGNGFYACELQADHLQWTGYSNDDKYGHDIAPMKPIMFNNLGDAKDIVFDYSDLVWDPARSTSPAPKRTSNENLTKAVIRMANANYNDRVVVLQSEEYTDDRNMTEYANEMLSLYVASEKNYDIYGSTDLSNTVIGYHAANAGIYTLSFEKVQGNALTLVDLANGAQVNIEEGATYTFAASANETNDARFQIVEARKMPTDVEVVDAAKAQKGIYNMVGQYLGEDFDVLPAGIYVVNGVKVVK